MLMIRCGSKTGEPRRGHKARRKQRQQHHPQTALTTTKLQLQNPQTPNKTFSKTFILLPLTPLLPVLKLNLLPFPLPPCC